MCTRKNWTEQQDEYLRKCVPDIGKKNWVEIAKNFNKVFENKTKTPKQCRQRFVNHSSIAKEGFDVNQWSQEENRKLFHSYQVFGSKWAKISQMIPGKSENSTKNKFYSCLRKFVRRINKIIKVQKKKSYKEVLQKSIIRIMEAIDSFEALPLELKQIAQFIKDKIICYSNPNNASSASDEEITKIITQINKFNLRSRSYKPRKGHKKYQFKSSTLPEGHMDISINQEDLSKNNQSVSFQNEEKIQNTNLDKNFKWNLDHNQLNDFIKLEDLPFEQYGIEYNDESIQQVRRKNGSSESAFCQATPLEYELIFGNAP